MRSVRTNPYVGFNRPATVTSSGAIVARPSTIGKRNMTTTEARAIRSQTLVSMAKRTGVFELIWYPTFILGGLLCLILLPIDLELILCVAQLFIAMTANNLAARGKRIGLLLNTVSMAMYVYVSATNAVWGEVIINSLLYIPLEIIGFFKWKQASEGNSSNLLVINKFTPMGYVYCTLAIVGATGAIFSVLHFGLKQNFAIFNAIGIATGLIGNMVRNKRYIETWFIYVLCNLAGIALWACEAFASGGALSLSVLPLMLSYTSTLTNDFNGWALWGAMRRKQSETDRVFLAKRKVNVNKIARLKASYRKFTCAETSDVAGLKFRER